MSRLHNYKPLILLFFFSFCSLQADRLPGSFRLRLSEQMIKVHPVMQLPPAQFRQPRLPAIPSPQILPAAENWGAKLSGEGKVPVGNASFIELQQYHAYYAQKTDKKSHLSHF